MAELQIKVKKIAELDVTTTTYNTDTVVVNKINDTDQIPLSDLKSGMVMTPATDNVDGTAGMVPTPTDPIHFLSGSGWQTGKFGGGVDYKYVAISPSDLVSDSTYIGYSYKYTIPWPGVTVDSYLKSNLYYLGGSDFMMPILLESTSDTVTVYFQVMVSDTIVGYVYAYDIEIPDEEILKSYIKKDELGSELAIEYYDYPVLGGLIVSQDTTNTTYPYYVEVAMSTVTASDWADARVLTGSYTGRWGIETASGKVILRFSKQPDSNLQFRIFRKKMNSRLR